MDNRLNSLKESAMPISSCVRRPLLGNKSHAQKRWPTVIWLHDAGDIGQDEVAAAQRWRAELDYAGMRSFEGPTCFDAIEKGRVDIGLLERRKYAVRLERLRQILGASLHNRVEMMLVREMSFPDMASLIFPEGPRAQAFIKTVAQCALALVRLSEFYQKNPALNLLSK